MIKFSEEYEKEFHAFLKDCRKFSTIKKEISLQEMISTKIKTINLQKEIKGVKIPFFYPTIVINGIEITIGEYANAQGHVEIDFANDNHFYAITDRELFAMKHPDFPLPLNEIFNVILFMFSNRLIYLDFTI